MPDAGETTSSTWNVPATVSGTRSLWESNGNTAPADVVASVLDGRKATTVPSARPFFRYSPAAKPVALGLLSTAMRRPVRDCRRGTIALAMSSAPPPAVKPTRIRSALSGRLVSARARDDSNIGEKRVGPLAAPNTTRERRDMDFLTMDPSCAHFV